MQRALEACIQIGAYHKSSVLRMLDHRKLRVPVQDIPFAYTRWQRNEITRPLSAYAGLVEEVVGHE
jgi:hypothetical protein